MSSNSNVFPSTPSIIWCTTSNKLIFVHLPPLFKGENKTLSFHKSGSKVFCLFFHYAHVTKRGFFLENEILKIDFFLFGH